MRCRYCAYSGKYYYHRQHGNQLMTTATMRKAVDFYLENSAEVTPKSIRLRKILLDEIKRKRAEIKQ